MIKNKNYRRLGIKLTPQRLAVLNFLEGNKTHPSAEVVYKAVKRKFPTISFATVYNILETLKTKALIQELGIDPARKRFDSNIQPHHHFFCNSCGKVFDIEAKLEPEAVLPLPGGFLLGRAEVNLYGVCPECQRKRKS